jgi:uncharacterized protein (TIGR02284 family)
MTRRIQNMEELAMTDVNIIDPATAEKVQDLIRTNLASRDTLYAMADNLSGPALEKVCRRLADELGGNVAELQQLLLTRGVEPVEPDDALATMLRDALLEVLRQEPSYGTIVEKASECEHALKKQYETAINETQNKRVEGVLYQQRKEVELGEEVFEAIDEAQRKLGEDNAGASI